MDELITGLALVLVIEGLLYALLPRLMKEMIVGILALPASTLRIGGVVALAAGVGLVWVVRG